MICSILKPKNNIFYPNSEALMHACKLNTPQARVGFYPSVRTR